jgi:hypothetical protein
MVYYVSSIKKGEHDDSQKHEPGLWWLEREGHD